MQKEDSFQLPLSILNQIHECCLGGFVLFFFDENGTPKIVIQTDSEASFLALQNHIEIWSKSTKDNCINNCQIIDEELEQDLEDEED